ncbi:uncharacterized protein LOC108704225 [Xenopus laevis]|uniref:Uncharacterized protein LOC108704225 n=1 Tax=Xenopus laevis TaxID=8355 RepID=A0A8J1LYI3_XENLA|nr:uncharacterized protein LOC108704225 [Xenopus laevis]XP_041434558.1 uncharacterized protein LOC108704225 [Xenopus laevis]OCT58292.1 hypothetical protein XELAEV_18002230mg [Xenopus laevis]
MGGNISIGNISGSNVNIMRRMKSASLPPGDIHTVTEDIKATGRKLLTKTLEGKYVAIIEDLEVYFSHEQADGKSCHGTEIKGEQWEEEVLGRSRELALTLQGKELSEEKLQEEFSGLWESCGFKGKILVPAPWVYQEKLKEFKAGSNAASLISNSSLWANLPEKFTEYLSTKSEKLSADEKIKVEKVTQGIEKRVKEFTDRKREEKKENETSYYEEVSSLIRVEISSKLHSDFPFPNEFLVFVPMYLCHRAAHSFAQISHDFNKSIDPQGHLEMKREEFFQSFKSIYAGTK